jgi:hypothetical protein
VRCTVVNLSAGGAGLSVERVSDLPPHLLLLIDGENQPRQCRIVWSEANRLGVSFQ